MEKLKNKVLKYIINNEGENIIVDSEIEIDSEKVIQLALNINEEIIVNKKVLINIERSADYISLIFALWINGNTVIPTNVNWPENYINEISNTCQADLILNKDFYKKLTKKSLFKEQNFKEKVSQLKSITINNKIPYIIFTSGTTSKQKGVVISENSYLSYLAWTSKEFDDYKHLKSLILTSELNFDITFGDLAFALFSNCKIVLPKNNTNIFEIIQLIDKYNIEIMYTVPNLFKLLFIVLKQYKIKKTIKLFISGGEALNKQICVEAKNLFPKSSFYNVYGPTECTINITSYKVNLDELKDKKVVPIGKIFDHLYWKIIPTEYNPKIGELLVGGSQLMDGYINKKYDFIEIENKIYYNTGDLVTVERGQIFWLSRNDSMIKKKGLRIFTTEIDEVVERNNKDIISKTVFIKDELILFFRGNAKASSIKDAIKQNLPPHMHPYEIINVENFPLGATGKIDVNQLINNYASGKN